MDEEDTEVGPAPRALLLEVSLADTGEWESTDRDVEAQGTIDHAPSMFEDTGVIIDPPTGISFRHGSPSRACTIPQPRAVTASEWPPAPREPAVRAPQARERTFRRAGFYAVVARPDDTKH